jgi:protein pelota
MRSSFDLKHNIAKLMPETGGDLAVLRDIITPGSLVTAKSPRSIKVKREGELVRAKTGRKEVVMKVQIEKIELREALRLTGKIVEAPEDVDRGYHTIEVEPKKFLRVEKPWKSWEVQRIRDAEKKPEPVLICIIDENEAEFYFLKERYKQLFTIENESSGKSFESKKSEVKRGEYYAKVLEDLKKRSEKVTKIVIAGPGFARDDLQNLIKQRAKELLPKIIVEFTYQSGNLGLQELLKKGLIEKITMYSRIAEETKAVERFLERISKGKAVYGQEKVKEALSNGVVELLLISNEKVREYEGVLDEADKMRCSLMIISSEHESGQKLLGLGGVAALTF